MKIKLNTILWELLGGMSMNLSYIQQIDQYLHLYITIGLVMFVALLTIWLVILTFRNSRLRKKYEAYIQNPDGKKIETIIDEYYNDFNSHKNTVHKIDKQLSDIQIQNLKNFSKIGLVRFSAFSEVGSDLSFAIALMNSKNSGFVITSIYGRNDNRLYAKPLENGSSSYRLSEEEELAIKQAMES